MNSYLFSNMNYINDNNYNDMEQIINEQVSNGKFYITIYLSRQIVDFSIFNKITDLYFCNYYYPLTNLPENLKKLELVFDKKKYEHKLDNLPPQLKLLSIEVRGNLEFDILLDHLPQGLEILQVSTTTQYVHEFTDLPNSLRLFMCANSTTDNYEDNYGSNGVDSSIKVVFDLPDQCIAILRRSNYVCKNKKAIVYVNQFSDYHFMDGIEYLD